MQQAPPVMSSNSYQPNHQEYRLQGSVSTQKSDVENLSSPPKKKRRRRKKKPKMDMETAFAIVMADSLRIKAEAEAASASSALAISSAADALATTQVAGIKRYFSSFPLAQFCLRSSITWMLIYVGREHDDDSENSISETKLGEEPSNTSIDLDIKQVVSAPVILENRFSLVNGT
jgi:hypothetical protein